VPIINILFLVGIVFIILFYFYVFNSNNERKQTDLKFVNISKRISVSLFFILFLISLYVLKQYQNPNNNSPYFKNTNHFAISNYAIAFNNEITLYGDSMRAIWNSETNGEMKLNIIQNDINLNFNDFSIPVFKIDSAKKTTLLNPRYTNAVIDNGFKLTNDINTLECIKYTSNIDNIYNLQFKFSTTDTNLNQKILYKYFIINNVKIQRGITLLNLFKKSIASNSISDFEIEQNIFFKIKNKINNLSNIKKIRDDNLKYFLNWLENEDLATSFFLTNNSVSNIKPTLQYYPNQNSFNTYFLKINNKKIKPLVNITSNIPLNNQIFIGLENYRFPFLIRSLTEEENHFASDYKNVLEYKYYDFKPLNNNYSDTVLLNSVELKFLKNTNDDIINSNIREGFVFHNNMNSNQFNNYDAYIKFYNNKPNNILNYEILTNNNFKKDSTNNDYFSIISNNQKQSYLFKIKDFSKNNFSYLHIAFYLLIIFLLFIYIIIFLPGKNLIFIETPLYFIIYMFMTYRFLLLWRVATFPPTNNISNNELDTLLNFDLKLPYLYNYLPPSLMIPISLIFVIIFSIIIITIRKGLFAKLLHLNNGIITKNIFKFFRSLNINLFKKNYLRFHILILFISSFIISLNVEILIRIFSILIPILSYFIFEQKIYNQNILITYKLASPKNTILKYLFNFFTIWIKTPVFYLSTLTFLFLFIHDRGFAILFIFYLLLKNIIINFALITRPPYNSKSNFYLNPANYFIFGFIFLFAYLFFLNYKPAFSLFIDYKIVFFVFLIILITSIIYISHYRKIIIWIISMIFIFTIVLSHNFINNFFDTQLKNVKYRTQILYTPLEEILFNQEYSSNNETKLLQTAQNQWYINSYINPEKLDYKTNYINFRPHFKTGVDYSTQTRDLVLPRYVISEFGHSTVIFLLLLLLIPIILYIPSYKITTIRKNEYLSLTSFYALIFIFTLSLFVWLTATNRLVFFGQDFPFLSLTSRLSVLLPLSLILLVLLSDPIIKLNINFNLRQRLIPLGLFILFLFINIIIAVKKSNYLKEDKFRINFKNVEINLDEKINKILYRIQEQPDPLLTFENYEISNKLIKSKINNIITALSTDTEFLHLQDTFTIYEKTMIKSLFEKPADGFEISNPLTYKFNEGRLILSFNQSWHLELPVYNIDKVWKADILANNYATNTKQNFIEITNEFTKDGGDILTIPSSYLIEESNNLGILNLNTKNAVASPYAKIKSRVINKNNKTLTTSDTKTFSQILQKNSIYIINIDDNNYQIKPFLTNSDKYFAQSFNINGYQKLIYPLESKYFWIKNWANYIQDYKQSQNDLNSDYTINLDYELTKEISKYLHEKRNDLLTKNKEMTLSAIAADGNGRITLLIDYANQRPIINPNDELQYIDEINKDYFDINPKEQRLKWGNINLLRMDIGPGSSVKPLIASTIASQLNLDWQNINVNGDNALKSAIKGNKLINKFAGLSMKPYWDLEKHDERDINFVTYLSKSDNIYHSVLIFLGSYKKDDFKLNNNYSLNNILDNTPYDTLSNYPILKINGQTKYLPSIKNLNKTWPYTYINNNNNNNTYFASNNSLLATGINNNLKLKFEPSNVYNNTTVYTSNFTSFYDSNYKNWVWSFPEESYFRNKLRSDKNKRTNFDKAIRNTALGGEPFQVTPFSILEMYGKLISQNSRYSLKIDGTITDTPIAWNIDIQTWKNKNSFHTFLSDNVFKGMKESAIGEGTASVWLSKIFNKDDNKKYFIYAKTGTSGSKKDNSSSRRLIVLITKFPINPDNITKNKFYNVYFTYNKIHYRNSENDIWYYPYTQDIIRNIINSESFKQYMQ